MTTIAATETGFVLHTPLAAATLRPAGVIRNENADFQVREILAFEPCGDGEHRYFQVRKCGHNSQWVADALAAATGTHRRDVGFAGHKDRHGIATQWFSICDVGDGRLDSLPDGIEVLAETRHRKKLQRGALRGNRFDITVRGLDDSRFDPGVALADISRRGFPNYFGEQRFGRCGANLDRARDWFKNGRVPRRRNLRSFALSAARSQLFNLLLGWRVEAGNWCEFLPGDIAQLAGTRSVFRIDEPDVVLKQRIESGDLSPTGPLWGKGDPRTGDDALALEMQLCEAESDLTRGLAASGLRHERRALRVLPADLTGVMCDSTLRLRFTLPRGCFATALLREIIEYTDASVDRAAPAQLSSRRL